MTVETRMKKFSSRSVEEQPWRSPVAGAAASQEPITGFDIVVALMRPANLFHLSLINNFFLRTLDCFPWNPKLISLCMSEGHLARIMVRWVSPTPPHHVCPLSIHVPATRILLHLIKFFVSILEIKLSNRQRQHDFDLCQC
jgi:hypothetical protein